MGKILGRGGIIASIFSLVILCGVALAVVKYFNGDVLAFFTWLIATFTNAVDYVSNVLLGIFVKK